VLLIDDFDTERGEFFHHVVGVIGDDDKSGLVEGCADEVLQMPMIASTLGLRPLIRFFGSPVVG